MTRFSKIHGTGNDFIVINNMAGVIAPEDAGPLARRLCERKRSVGADGLLLIEKARSARARNGFFVRVLNADGSEAEMCGNGMRCAARYAFEERLSQGERLVIDTLAGTVEALKIDRRRFRIRLPDPSEIGLRRVIRTTRGQTLEYTCVGLGEPPIPHIVLRSPAESCEGEGITANSALRDLARELRFHAYFVKGTNVNFFRQRADGDVDLLTYERGVENFTLACGTGAGSTALALNRLGLAGSHVRILTPGGLLEIDIAREGLYLTGETVYVARGELMDEA